MDWVCRKLTKGRTTVPELLAGLPVVFVTSTGRKSGQRRTHPLFAVPYQDNLALIGTNFGGKRTPGWVFNLEANPSARVEFRNAGADVNARSATEDERTEIWKSAEPVYLGYDKYRQRINNREVRIFVLEPASR
jgi:deazaflavin-dependent oxidoreductase (nitroreductase family)